jgi:tetratricopeptide (TPR) repeat protein
VRRLLGFALFAAVFTLYLWAAPPGLYWLDSGELTSAAMSLGVAHPTGFPLFCLAGKAAALVPLGEVAFRVDLLSAACGAGAIYGLYRMLCRWLGESGAATAGAVFGALLPAIGLTFFRESSVAEVYAPTALLLVIAVGLIVRVVEKDARARDGLALGLVLGLSLGLHAQLRWLVVVPGLAVLGWRAIRGRRRWAWAAPAVLVIGAGVLLEMPVRAAAERQPAANWNHPRTVGAAWDQMSAGRIRRAFAGEMLSHEPRVVMRNAASFTSMTVTQLSPLAPILAAIGIYALIRRRSFAAVLLLWIGGLDFIYATWVNPMGIEDLQNGVPLHLMIGAAAGAGIAWLGGRLGRAGSAASFAVGLCAVIVAAVSDTSAKLGASDGADRVLHAVLAETPPRGSVLAISDDINAGLQFARALGERPDVIALPQQHLWDRALVAQVFAHAGAEPPKDIVRALVARGETLWEEGPELPPQGLYLVPAAPLPRLSTLPNKLAQAPREMMETMRFACDAVGHDPKGLRACSYLIGGLGSVLYRAGDSGHARAMLEIATNLYPDNVSALVNLGVVQASLHQLRIAAETEEKAPIHNYAAQANAGRYRLALGEDEIARRHFENARALNPSAPLPHAGLAVTLAHAHRCDEAQASLAHATPPNDEIRAYAAEVSRLCR